MDVVVVVHDGVHPLRSGLADVRAVHFGGDGVGLLRRDVVARADVDVRGHVHEVAGRRHERLQPLGRGKRALGALRGFGGVDVEVVRARMVGVALQDRLEHGDDLDGVRSRLAGGRPELPRRQVHQALGVESRGVEVVRIARGERLHGRRVVARDLRLVGIGRVGDVANRERLDVGALVLRPARREGQGLLDLGPRLQEPLVDRRRVVVVRSQHERHAPARHGGLRVELGGPARRSDRPPRG